MEKWKVMREILFRGNRKDNGELIEGNLVVCVDQYFICVLIGNQLVEFEVYPDTVGQYTGLTDKNGKKIFEGDILEFVQKVIVRWHDRFGGFVLDPVVRSNAYLQWMMFDNGIIPYEIIGNIHDNPKVWET